MVGGKSVGAASAQINAQDLAAKARLLLRELIRTPSFEPAQCHVASRIVETAMREAGFDLDVHVVRNPSGVELRTIVGWLGPRTPQPAILLCAHLDTSPPGKGWTRDPFGGEQSGGYIYGRGANVSKSDVAGFIYAAKAGWDALDDVDDRSIAVAVTSDEGSGGDHGAAYLLNDLGFRPSIAIFPGFTEVITTAHFGCVQLAVKISGTACHQSMLPRNQDAMRFASQLCAAVYSLADSLSATPDSTGLVPTLNVTLVRGGTAFGMAPSEVDVWVDRRVSPNEDLRCAEQELLSLVRGLQSTPEIKVECEIIRLAEPMRPSQQQLPYISVFSEEARLALGQPLTISTSTLYTDARWFADAGIPTLMYGAGEANVKLSGANGADERIPEGDVARSIIVLARSVNRILNSGALK